MRGLVFFFLCCAVATSLLAHDSPEHQVELLTSIMASQGKSGSLLVKRAIEYRVLGQLDKAVQDLQEALQIKPADSYAWKELCRLYLAQGKPDAAVQAVNKALSTAEDEEERAPTYMLRAEVYGALNKTEDALADMERAFKNGSPDLDWYIQRGQLQAKAGKWDDCLRGLKQGFDETSSIVLEIEWIEAMIDAGKSREALALIEPHISKARWKASWLLRRARARKALKLEYEQDLLAVLKELDERANPRYPDLTLLADRGLACALLGKNDEARKNYEAAKQLGADAWVLRRLEPLLKKSS
jgi:tetratricopeptide (TPR) repeat protein